MPSLRGGASPQAGQITVGADKGYDAKSVAQCRLYGIRKRVEEIFGWAKTVGGFRKTRFKGIRRTQLAAYFVGAAYSLVRMFGPLPATG